MNPFITTKDSKNISSFWLYFLNIKQLVLFFSLFLTSIPHTEIVMGKLLVHLGNQQRELRRPEEDL